LNQNDPLAVPEALFVDLLQDSVRVFGLPETPRIVLLRTLKNPYSDVHVFEVTKGSFCQRIYVKIPYSDSQSMPILRSRLATEYEVMRRLNSPDMENEKFGVAVPFGYYHEYPAIATLEAGITSLRVQYRRNARLLGSSYMRDRLLEDVENCGYWLKRFQALTLQGAAPFDLAELSAYCTLRLDRLVSNEKIEFPKGLSERIVQTIHALGQSISAQGVQVVGRHNDFASHNILAGNGKVWIIDFSMFDYGASIYDPCNFWLDIEALKLDPTYSGTFLEALQERFMVAYGGMSMDDPAFMLARCRYTLNRLVTSLDRTKGWSARAIYRRRIVRDSLNWLKCFAAS
jgi:hypothetical protein